MGQWKGACEKRRLVAFDLSTLWNHERESNSLITPGSTLRCHGLCAQGALKKLLIQGRGHSVLCAQGTLKNLLIQGWGHSVLCA